MTKGFIISDWWKLAYISDYRQLVKRSSSHSKAAPVSSGEAISELRGLIHAKDIVCSSHVRKATITELGHARLKNDLDPDSQSVVQCSNKIECSSVDFGDPCFNLCDN